MKTDEHMKKENPELYRVARDGATERPFAGKYVDTKDTGTYHCAVCDAALFPSDTKFDSGSGWPSFTDPVNQENIILKDDTDHGMTRTEVACKNCNAHLGHVFNDGPRIDETTRKSRYCINSVCLDLKKDENK